MRNKILIILFCFCNTFVFAQSELIISGQVFSKHSTEPLAYAQIVINHDKGIICNNLGQFRTWVAANDTLTASFLGYQSKDYIMPDSLVDNEYIIGFFLDTDTMRLSEVVIFPRFTPEELRRQMTTAMPYSTEDINARKNLDIASSTALRENHLIQNSEQYQDIAIRKQQVRTEYKGMFSPDQLAGFNFVTLAGMAVQIIKGTLINQEEHKVYVTAHDSRKLREIFETRDE
jgi:hypothetical protein